MIVDLHFFQMQQMSGGGGGFLTLTFNDDDVCVTDVSDDESLHLDHDVEEMVEVAPGTVGIRKPKLSWPKRV